MFNAGPSSSGPFQVPQLLFAGTKETKRGWRSFGKSLWKLGDWHAALSNVPHVSFADANTNIVVRNVYGWSTNVPTLQLHWIQHCGFESPEVLRKDPEKESRLWLEGLRYLWFAIGSSAMSFSGRQFINHFPEYWDGTGKTTASGRKELFIPWFRALLAWFPELIAVEHRLVSAIPNRVDERGRFIPGYGGFMPTKLVTIPHVALMAGLIEELKDENTSGIAALRDCLLRRDAIKEKDGRYELTF